MKEPFGVVSNKKIDISPAKTPIQFLLKHEKRIIAIASKHIYVLDFEAESIVDTIPLKLKACFAFIIKSKLYVGGDKTINIFHLSKWPYPKISTIKISL